MTAGLVRRLVEVRDGAPLLDEVAMAERPPDLDSAYAIADEIVGTLTSKYGHIAAYKVGATSVAGQKLLGLSEPFYGRIFATRVLKGETPSFHGDLRACSVEAEVGFLMGTDLPPRTLAYTDGEVVDAIARVVPLFEINRPSFARPFDVGGLCLIADNGVTQGLVIGGPGIAFGQDRQLAIETVRMFRNGEPCAEGSAMGVLGDPLRAVTWLANALSARGHTLRAGHLIASGAMTSRSYVVTCERYSCHS